MLWRKTINLWKIALTANGGLFIKTLGAFTLLNLLFFTPLQPLSVFLQNLLTFSLITYFSKLYLEVKEERAFKERVLTTEFGEASTKYLLHALALLFAQYVMSFLLVVFVVAALFFILSLFGLTFVVFGATLPSWAVFLFVLVVIFLYFSMATSYPLFFARAVVEGRDPKDYFVKFLTAPFSPLLMKMGFSLPLLVSSLIVSAIVLGLFVLQFILYHLIPPTAVLSFFFTYANLLLVYLFGVVSLKDFVDKNREELS